MAKITVHQLYSLKLLLYLVDPLQHQCPGIAAVKLHRAHPAHKTEIGKEQKPRSLSDRIAFLLIFPILPEVLMQRHDLPERCELFFTINDYFKEVIYL